MASTSFLRSNTLAGILFRTVFVLTAWYASSWVTDRGIYLFAPRLWPIYANSEVLIAVIRTAIAFLIFWAIVLLPEKQSWSEVGWTRKNVGSSLLGGGLIGAGVYLTYVGVVDACGWYRITGHYSWSHFPRAAFVALLYASGIPMLYSGYLLNRVEQLQGTSHALAISTLMFSSSLLIDNVLLAAFDSSYAAPYNSHFAQGVILSCAMGMFYGAAYLWSQRLWTVVGISWGMGTMDYLWTNDDPYLDDLAVFRFSLSPHSFDLTGIVFITKVSIFIIAAVVMMILAKRRGHWQVRGASKSQS